MLVKFVPQSPDPFLQTGDDMSLAKFGHLNELVKEINALTPVTPVTSVTATAPCVSSGGTTPAISIPQADAATDGYCSASDFASFEGKQDALTLTTAGSGAATLVGSTLNVPTPAASPLLTTTATLTAANLLAGAGIDILPAPAATKYYVIQSLAMKFKAGSVAFDELQTYEFNMDRGVIDTSFAAAAGPTTTVVIPSSTTDSLILWASGGQAPGQAFSIAKVSGPGGGNIPSVGDSDVVFDVTYELKDF
jgi:hypothetical protein